MPEDTRKKGGDDGGRALEEFLGATLSFVDDVSKAFAEAVGADNDAPLIASSSQVVREQFGALCDEVRTSYGSAGAVARRGADEIVRLQRGVLLARSGAETASLVLKRGVGGGFFAWISQHLAELKKLLRFIWEEILKWDVDKFDKFETFIDEIWELIVGLVGGALGFRRAEIADELSRRAVNTKNELAALERLRNAGQPRADADED